MNTLYFDLDGTILELSSNREKAALAGGALEASLRTAGFERLVCVSNLTAVIQGMNALGREVDGIRILLNFCGFAIEDAEWFRENTVLVSDSHRRVAHVDRTADWWYMYDLALPRST